MTRPIGGSPFPSHEPVRPSLPAGLGKALESFITAIPQGKKAVDTVNAEIKQKYKIDLLGSCGKEKGAMRRLTSIATIQEVAHELLSKNKQATLKTTRRQASPLSTETKSKASPPIASKTLQALAKESSGPGKAVTKASPSTLRAIAKGLQSAIANILRFLHLHPAQFTARDIQGQAKALSHIHNEVDTLCKAYEESYGVEIDQTSIPTNYRQKKPEQDFAARAKKATAGQASAIKDDFNEYKKDVLAYLVFTLFTLAKTMGISNRRLAPIYEEIPKGHIDLKNISHFNKALEKALVKLKAEVQLP